MSEHNDEQPDIPLDIEGEEEHEPDQEPTPAIAPISAPIHYVQRFNDFFRLFQDRPNSFKYQRALDDIHNKNGNVLVFLYEDLLAHDQLIADLLRQEPERVLTEANDAFRDLIRNYGGTFDNAQHYFVRVSTDDKRSPLFVPLRQIHEQYVDKLVYFNGIVIRTSVVRPQLLMAKFLCLICLKEFQVIQLTNKIRFPHFCIDKKCKAKSKSDFQYVSTKSERINYQTAVVQENPEDVPSGYTPQSITIHLLRDMVDSVKPGDRVSVMGIFKAIIPTSESVLLDTYIDALYVDPEDKSNRDIDLTSDERAEIDRLSREPDIQKKIASSIATNIYGRDDLKMACALSMFGGTKSPKPGGGHTRANIHVLFVGDPGTGKSEILKSVIDITPRGIYSSGKGSSAVGLTAAVLKDQNGQMNLEAGVLVLANGGIAAIDEFDKMESADRSAIHEQLEQQTISIAKGGIVATLKAETAVIASANPVHGRYDPFKTPSKNINMPSSLLSRFDLIFVVKDVISEQDDINTADIVLQLSLDEGEGKPLSAEPPISIPLLKKYIRYARRTCNPMLTKEASESIKKFYLTLRTSDKGDGAVITILARQLEALVRLSTAHAKMALRRKVIKEDVDAIIELFSKFIKDVGYDDATGKIDMDRLFVGAARSTTKKDDTLKDALQRFFEDTNYKESKRTAIISAIETTSEGSFTKSFIEKNIDKLIESGFLYEPKNGFLKLTIKEDPRDEY